MKLEDVGVILYTVRDFCKTPEGFVESLGKIADIGYKGVQISGVCEMDAVFMQEQCEAHGLRLMGTHEAGANLFNHTEASIEKLKSLGVDFTAYPYPAGVDFASEASVGELIANLERVGKRFKEAGLKLCYHNHHQEFRKLGGEIILDKIYGSIAEDVLYGEPDTYWIQVGGQDPVRYCEKLKGRLHALHMKDYRINEENEVEFTEMGNGNLDFKRIISAAEASGCRYFIVEQDTCPGDPFDSLGKSFDYITGHLLES